MRTKKLSELLTLVNGVSSYNWNTVVDLVDIITKGKAIIKSKKWHDDFKQHFPEHYPLDLSVLSTWSTFSNTCIDLKFVNEKVNKTNQLVCYAKVYDGESFHGDRISLRFDATIWLPTTAIHIISNQIEYEFNSHLEREYEKYLEKQKKDWINKLRSEIIN